MVQSTSQMPLMEVVCTMQLQAARILSGTIPEKRAQGPLKHLELGLLPINMAQPCSAFFTLQESQTAAARPIASRCLSAGVQRQQT